MRKIFIYIVFALVTIGLKGQSLESYLQEAELNSPMIQALELRYNIAKEKVKEVNTLPNTTIGANAALVWYYHNS